MSTINNVQAQDQEWDSETKVVVTVCVAGIAYFVGVDIFTFIDEKFFALSCQATKYII